MAQKSTDLQSEMPQGVPDEFRIGAGWVLAAVWLSRFRSTRRVALTSPGSTSSPALV